MTSTENDSDAKALGAEIREVRKARGLTLKHMSAQISCSLAYLSRIERGTAKVSNNLLAEIGAALDVDPVWFFPDRSGKGPLERSHVVRKDARRPLTGMYTRSSEELGFEDELLSSTLGGGFYLLMSRFPIGAEEMNQNHEGYMFDGEQHGMVLQGQITLTLGDEEIVLDQGDSFSYPSTLPHRFRNTGEDEAVMVWAMAPVRISW